MTWQLYLLAHPPAGEAALTLGEVSRLAWDTVGTALKKDDSAATCYVGHGLLVTLALSEDRPTNRVCQQAGSWHGYRGFSLSPYGFLRTDSMFLGQLLLMSAQKTMGSVRTGCGRRMFCLTCPENGRHGRSGTYQGVFS